MIQGSYGAKDLTMKKKSHTSLVNPNRKVSSSTDGWVMRKTGSLLQRTIHVLKSSSWHATGISRDLVPHCGKLSDYEIRDNITS